VRRIYEPGAGGHVYGIGTRPIVGAIFRFAGQLETRPIAPSADNGFAGLVQFNFIGLRWMLDPGKREAVALLDIENRVIGEEERGAAILFCCLLVVSLLTVA